jgi:hypothetical protein
MLNHRIMLNHLVECYDSIYESLREPRLSRRGDIFVFDRAVLDDDRGLKNCLGRMDFDKTRLNEPGGDPADQGESRQSDMWGIHGSNSRGYVGWCS